eukprot:gene1470-2829_t
MKVIPILIGYVLIHCHFNLAVKAVESTLSVIKPKVIDSFPFNGEPMGFLRLGYLMDVVDHFILIEANVTHSGFPKPVMFVDKYKEELHNLNKTGKITIHKISFKDTGLPWKRERYQRDVVKDIVLNMMGNQPFILIVSDADELLRKEFVAELPSQYNITGYNKFTGYDATLGKHFFVTLFTYSFKYISSHNWDQGYIINDIALKAMESKKTLSDIRTEVVHHIHITDSWRDAGWHCSYCFKAQDIARKIRSFAHIEHNQDALTRKEWIEDCVRTGKDVLNRTNSIFSTYDGANGYPHCELCKTLPGFKVLKIPDKKIN